VKTERDLGEWALAIREIRNTRRYFNRLPSTIEMNPGPYK